jgi:hypothetical protein
LAEPRDELGKKLTGYMKPEQVSMLIDEVLAIKKRTSAEFTCKACGKRQMHWTEVPDAKAVAGALSDLMNQAFGRPGETTDTVEPVLFQRLTKLEA